MATTLKRCKGGQFALHAMALPGNPYDGHTLETVIPAMEATIGTDTERFLADAGYRGHDAPLSHKFRVEPVIGHITNEHRIGRNYLAHAQGDAVKAILAAAGYNFALLLNWLKGFLCLVIAAVQSRPKERPA